MLAGSAGVALPSPSLNSPSDSAESPAPWGGDPQQIPRPHLHLGAAWQRFPAPLRPPDGVL
ncbi:MAG: hypothetical protein ACK55I_38355, partial [bacterium]